MTARRSFLAITGAALLEGAEPVVDIHQHTPYTGRTADELVQHQRTLGIAKTVLLPAGRAYGLAAGCGGNDTVIALARRYPKEFYFFANELPHIPETRPTLEKYLKMGAIGIGEQKFHVDADSKYIDLIAEIAREYSVPVLLHFEHRTYNMGIENFHKVLARHPKANFIGHAQTWWGNIDKNHKQEVMYPKTKVTLGGITDRLLADYPNMFGDLSAGSGLNSLQRDEEHGREFLRRHQDKLLYGSDCSDRVGKGSQCSGSQQIETIRRLASDARIQRKIFYENAARVMRVG
jgi:predicted TIM-barrel fold metal-dependent hydrolase